MVATPSNALEVSVSELSAKLKRTVEDLYGNVRVRGELGRISRPGSGHIYLDLKDDRAVLAGVIWKGSASRLKHQPEEGLEVIATGKLTTYPGQSKYQLVIDQIEPAGAGALMALLEERRKKLTAEGLFAAERKQPLPYMPRTIGVITSPTGAVIRDILHRLADRFPLHVMVWPVRVQGETSGAEVANGIAQFNTFDGTGAGPRPDLIIVARGGGSLEDLWGFNDEQVVRAVAASTIPLISAVGHETDWTLIDHAADWRAPTPTAAAEKAVPVKADLQTHLADLSARLGGSMARLLDRRRTGIRAASRGLASPDTLLAQPRQSLDSLTGRLGQSLFTNVRSARNRYEARHDRLSPLLLRTGFQRRLETLNERQRTLQRTLARIMERKASRADALSGRMRPQPLVQKLQLQQDRLRRSGQILQPRIQHILGEAERSVERNQRLLQTLSYKGVLARGYAVVRDGQNKPVASAQGISKGDFAAIEFRDGTIGAAITDAPPTQRKQRAKSSSDPAPGPQGSLF